MPRIHVTSFISKKKLLTLQSRKGFNLFLRKEKNFCLFCIGKVLSCLLQRVLSASIQKKWPLQYGHGLKQILRVDMGNVLVLMAWLVTMVAGQNDKLRLSQLLVPHSSNGNMQATVSSTISQSVPCNIKVSVKPKEKTDVKSSFGRNHAIYWKITITVLELIICDVEYFISFPMYCLGQHRQHHCHRFIALFKLKDLFCNFKPSHDFSITIVKLTFETKQ